MAEERINSLAGSGQSVASDIEQVFREHFDELGTRLTNELGKLTAAGTAFGGGLGMAALGTVLGGIGFVHLVHRVTGLPLWLCYMGSSAVACSTGAGLFAAGSKKVSQMNLLPKHQGQAGNGHKTILGARW